MLVAGMRPCEPDLACHDAGTVKADVCQASEAEHSCCTLANGADHAPSEEDPCPEGCACFCCVLVIAPAAGIVPLDYRPEAFRGAGWEASKYFHQYTHRIWQPPQAV
jgi:hypothetical protein